MATQASAKAAIRKQVAEKLTTVSQEEKLRQSREVLKKVKAQMCPHFVRDVIFIVIEFTIFSKQQTRLDVLKYR
jgi:ribosomal protein L17